LNAANQLRWLIIGGGLAGRVHAHALTRVAGAELAGMVSSKPSPIPGTPVFSTLEQALDATNAGAAIVATPNHTHANLIEALLSAGLPVLCEKPVGRDATEARRSLLRSQQLSVPIGVVLNQRFCSVNRWILKLITQQALAVRRVSFKVALPSLGGWQADLEQSGGGILRLLGVHYLDLMRWWLGEPDSLWAQIDGLPIDHAANIQLNFPGDRTGQLALTAQGDQHGGPPSCIVEADNARIELLGHQVVACEGVAAPSELDPSFPDQWFGPGHLNLLDQATQTLATSGKFPIDLAEALPSLQLVDDLYALA
jgi:predicted dehydrogenase